MLCNCFIPCGISENRKSGIMHIHHHIYHATYVSQHSIAVAPRIKPFARDRWSIIRAVERELRCIVIANPAAVVIWVDRFGKRVTGRWTSVSIAMSWQDEIAVILSLIADKNKVISSECDALFWSSYFPSSGTCVWINVQLIVEVRWRCSVIMCHCHGDCTVSIRH